MPELTNASTRALAFYRAEAERLRIRAGVASRTREISDDEQLLLLRHADDWDRLADELETYAQDGPRQEEGLF